MTDPFPPQPPAYPAQGGNPAPGGVPAPAGQPPYGAPGYPGQPAQPSAQPGYAPPPGAYAVPVGGYQSPIGGYAAPQPAAKGSSALGAVSLVLALVAVIVMPIVGGVFGGQIGAAVPGFFLDSDIDSSDLSGLSPARIQVLWAEIAFWIGTAIGVTAIVTGIIATAKRRGRGLGITGIVLAALGPVAFFLAVTIAAAIGAASAATSI